MDDAVVPYIPAVADLAIGGQADPPDRLAFARVLQLVSGQNQHRQIGPSYALGLTRSRSWISS